MIDRETKLNTWPLLLLKESEPSVKLNISLVSQAMLLLTYGCLSPRSAPDSWSQESDDASKATGQQNRNRAGATGGSLTPFQWLNSAIRPLVRQAIEQQFPREMVQFTRWFESGQPVYDDDRTEAAFRAVASAWMREGRPLPLAPDLSRAQRMFSLVSEAEWKERLTALQRKSIRPVVITHIEGSSNGNSSSVYKVTTDEGNIYFLRPWTPENDNAVRKTLAEAVLEKHLGGCHFTPSFLGRIQWSAAWEHKSPPIPENVEFGSFSAAAEGLDLSAAFRSELLSQDAQKHAHQLLKGYVGEPIVQTFFLRNFIAQSVDMFTRNYRVRTGATLKEQAITSFDADLSYFDYLVSDRFTLQAVPFLSLDMRQRLSFGRKLPLFYADWMVDQIKSVDRTRLLKDLAQYLRPEEQAALEFRLDMVRFDLESLAAQRTVSGVRSEVCSEL